jgi:hypothetical protein
VRTTKEVTIANDTKEIVSITDPVEVHWKNRNMVCQPWVLSRGDILLGAIPLENMDLIVDPRQQALVGAHGEKELGKVIGPIA